MNVRIFAVLGCGFMALIGVLACGLFAVTTAGEFFDILSLASPPTASNCNPSKLDKRLIGRWASDPADTKAIEIAGAFEGEFRTDCSVSFTNTKTKPTNTFWRTSNDGFIVFTTAPYPIFDRSRYVFLDDNTLRLDAYDTQVVLKRRP